MTDFCKKPFTHKTLAKLYETSPKALWKERKKESEKKAKSKEVGVTDLEVDGKLLSDLMRNLRLIP